MDKSHDSLVMGSSIRVSVQPVTVEIDDEVQEELLSVPFQLSIAFHRKVPILGIAVTHKGVIGLNHLHKGERNKSAPLQRVKRNNKCVWFQVVLRKWIDMRRAKDGGTKIISSDVRVPKAAIRAFPLMIHRVPCTLTALY